MDVVVAQAISFISMAFLSLNMVAVTIFCASKTRQDTYLMSLQAFLIITTELPTTRHVT